MLKNVLKYILKIALKIKTFEFSQCHLASTAVANKK